MKFGQHYCEWTIIKQGSKYSPWLGIVRPSFDPTSGQAGKDTLSREHCFYASVTGNIYPKNVWPVPKLDVYSASEAKATAGDCVGLLLDLDKGSLTVFKNYRRIGDIVTHGLHGSFCWCADLGHSGVAVRLSENRVSPWQFNSEPGRGAVAQEQPLEGIPPS